MEKLHIHEKQNAPFFSIIIPVYNVDLNYFDKCMDSILRQNFNDFEVIIVDDGSQSNCAKICDDYAKKDLRINVVHQKNLGVSAARNNGMKVGRADWIMFMDSDDWLENDAFDKLYSILKSNPCDILLFDHIKEYSSGKKVRKGTGLTNNKLYCTTDVNTKEMLYRRAMGTPNLGGINQSTIYYSWDKVYRREFIQKNNLKFPEGLPKSEDKVFILECFERVNLLYYTNMALYHYRINGDSATYKYSQYVDDERRDLSVYLEKIAHRMDSELAKLKGDSSYSLVYSDYMRFIFGIISNILFSKYYHKDYKGSHAKRRAEVKEFLKSDPFKTAIDFCKYTELGGEAKAKKFMLTHGLTSLFCGLVEVKRKISKQNNQ